MITDPIIGGFVCDTAHRRAQGLLAEASILFTMYRYAHESTDFDLHVDAHLALSAIQRLIDEARAVVDTAAKKETE